MYSDTPIHYHDKACTMYPEVVEGLWGVAKVIVAVGEEGVVRQRRDKVNMLLHTARERQVME